MSTNILGNISYYKMMINVARESRNPDYNPYSTIIHQY